MEITSSGIINSLKARLAVLFILFVSVIATAGLTGCDSIAGPPTTRAGAMTPTGIWVTGEGRVMVTPDVAMLNLRVEAQAASVTEATREAGAALSAVLNELRKKGLAESDIQTSAFNIQQVTRWDEDRQEVVLGYRANHTVTARIRTLPVESYSLDYKAEIVIESVVAAGGDFIRINGIDFTIDDPAPHRKEARKKALEDAYSKAKEIAEGSGLKLGDPVYISETGGANPLINMPQYHGVPAPTTVPGTPVSSGEMAVTVTVQVAYSIR